MSSFINKSGKKFAPKAPVRRRGGPGASTPKPASESGATEPSPAPPSEAGSDIGDRQQTPASTTAEDTNQIIAPSKAPEKRPPVVRSSVPPVDSTGIPVVQESASSQATKASGTSNPPITTSITASATKSASPAVQKQAGTRARSKSPAESTTTGGSRSSKRRRVDDDGSIQPSNNGPKEPQVTGAPASNSLSSTSSHVEVPSNATGSQSPSATRTSGTTQKSPVHTPKATAAKASTSKASSSASAKKKSQQWPLGNQIPKPVVRSSSKRARTPQPTASEPLVDYEVPGQAAATEDDQETPSRRAPASRSSSPSPIRAPRSRTPSAVEDENWQVTTPADILAIRHEKRQRSRSNVRNRESRTAEASGANTSRDSPVVQSASAAAVRRMANAIKRKRKQAARDSAFDRITGVATASAIDEAVTASIEGRLPRQVTVRPERQQEPAAPRLRRQRAVRQPTPEENETVVIAPGITRMNDLAKDMRVGQKSVREQKMREIDWVEVKRKRKEDEIRQATHRSRENADGNALLGGSDDDDDDDLDENERLERNYERNKQVQGQNSLRLRLVNGAHVIDEASQFIDRHAAGEEELLEEVEEDDITKKFNVATYATWRRKDPAERVLTHEKWTEDATDRFYDFLTQFGTDFMVISKMFTGRTRRHIKAKFIKEERADPDRVKEALMQHLTRRNDGDGWDIEAFRVGAGLRQSDLKDPDIVKKELEEHKAGMLIEIEEAKKSAAENERQLRLAGHWISEDERDEDGQPLPDDEIARRRKAKQDKIRKDKRDAKRAKKHGPPTGGAEEEVIETIEGED